MNMKKSTVQRRRSRRFRKVAALASGVLVLLAVLVMVGCEEAGAAAALEDQSGGGEIDGDPDGAPGPDEGDGDSDVGGDDQGGGEPPVLVWATETVVNTGRIGSSSSIALDADGAPHLAYTDLDVFSLKHVRWDGGAWSGLSGSGPDTVDTGGGDGAVGASSSLVLDANGRPHISYFDEGNEDLRYARWNGSAWTHADGTTIGPEVVDADGAVARFGTSLALDSDGRPHIAYDADEAGLRYVRWDGVAWVDVDGNRGAGVVEADGAGRYPSLALDADGRPHISYYTRNGRDLKYARWNGTVWVGAATGSRAPEIVDAENTAGQESSLALDADGTPHIAYHVTNDDDAATGDVRYAHWDGTAWVGAATTSTGPEIINTRRDVGAAVSLAVDADGSPHVTYFIEGDSGELMYTHWNGSAWVGATIGSTAPEIVDAENNDREPSLVLDAEGRPHIVYSGGRDDDVKYARIVEQ